MIYFSKKIFHCLKMYFERYNLLHSTRPKTRFLVGISSSLVSSPSVYACYTCVDIADTDTALVYATTSECTAHAVHPGSELPDIFGAKSPIPF